MSLYQNNENLSTNNSQKPDQPGYYAVIPASVRYDDSIPPNAKLLYGEISALIGKDGFCFASNQYFAERYGFREESIARLLTRLEKAGHIVREMEKDASGQIVMRKLFLSVSVPDGQGINPKVNTHCAKSQEGINPKVKDTNTSITNIDIKENKKEKSGKKPSTRDAEPFEPMPLFKAWITELPVERDQKNALYFAIERLMEVRASKKKDMKSKAAVTGLCNRLMRFTGGDVTQMLDLLDTACDQQWTTVFPRQDAATRVPPADDARRDGEWL